MDTFLGFTAIAITTLFALFLALGLQTLLLRATFALMRPATATRRFIPPAIERGTHLVARAYARDR
jgi:hypothetical protein